MECKEARVSLVASMDAQLVEQQDSVLFSVEAFDEFGNPIPVPIAAVVSVVPEGTLVRSSSSVWEFTTIQSGDHAFSVNVGPIYAEELSLEVDSTIAGTLAAAGPLAYIGLGLGVIAFIALLVLGVIILRRGDDVWDDYDDEDDEDGSPIAAGPSGPPSGPSGPPPARSRMPPPCSSGPLHHRPPDQRHHLRQAQQHRRLSRNPPRNLRPGVSMNLG